MTLLYRALLLFIMTIHNAQAFEDGRWQLTISGHDRIEFGTEFLAGGLTLKWETVLDFTIQQNAFVSGTGTARLLPDIQIFSRPPNMFECKQVIGTFASRSGLSFSTPHLRYQAFPVSGKVENNAIQLNPYLEYPGNYYAILYECTTHKEQGSFWVERAPRVSRELSKRQDSTITVKDGSYRAQIKEVKSIDPGIEIKLPLIDGLKFELLQDYGLRSVEYRLEYLESQKQ